VDLKKAVQKKSRGVRIHDAKRSTQDNKRAYENVVVLEDKQSLPTLFVEVFVRLVLCGGETKFHWIGSVSDR
jgi:hypothetical protein